MGQRLYQAALRRWNEFSSSAKVVLILTFGAVIIAFHGIPFYYQYGNSEIQAVVKYALGVFRPNPNLFLHDALDFKYGLWLMKGLTFICQIFGIQPYRLDHLLFFLTCYLGFLGIYFFLRNVGLRRSWAAPLALMSILMNPLVQFVYGYSYKVGVASGSLGQIAFATITLLLYAHFARKVVLHSCLLILLYFIHPLNTLLYLGMITVHNAVEFMIAKAGSRRVLLKRIVPDFALLGLFLLASYRYAAISEESPGKMFGIIYLINSRGDAGGYFFSWLRPSQLAGALIFIPSLVFLVVGAWRKKYLEQRLSIFALCCIAYATLLCVVNYIAYRARIDFLLPLDMSRVFGYLTPIAIVCISKVIYARRNHIEAAPAIVSISLLVFAWGLSTKLYWLPIFVVFLIYGREKYVFRYMILLFIMLSVSFFLEVDKEGVHLKALTLYGQRAKLIIWLGSLIILLSKVPVTLPMQRFVPRIVPIVFLLILWPHEYHQRMSRLYRSYKPRDVAYKGLVDYVHKNTEPNTIFLTMEEPFGFCGIRPLFLYFHSITYAIYLGNLEKLEREAKLVWDIELTEEFAATLHDSLNYGDKGGLHGYMRERLELLSPDRISKIKEKFPEFRYVLVDNEFEFARADLPLRECYRNKLLRLYKLTEAVTLDGKTRTTGMRQQRNDAT